MASIVSGVADNSTPSELNPKQIMQRRNRRRKVNRLTSAKSPTPAQIKDADEYKKFFADYKETYLPFAGTDKYSSHGLLGFLLSLKEISPTKSAVIRSKIEFALSGMIDIVAR